MNDFDFTGIEYRLMDNYNISRSNYGRVDIQIDGEWGTVCDQSLDDLAAKVICKGQNFTDGVILRVSQVLMLYLVKIMMEIIE